MKSGMNEKGYLIDLDGTLISGQQVLPDAEWLLGQVEGRFIIVSNNAEHTPKQLARRLKRMGLAVTEQQLLLAGTLAIEQIASRRPGCRVMLLGSRALISYARQQGLKVNEGQTEVVLVMRDRQFSYQKLAAAAAAISAGAELVISAPDLSHPGSDGFPVPETGALAAAIVACVGECHTTVIGKPETALFEMGCDRLGTRPQETIMIGDNPATDGAGAARVGMRFWPVKDGRLLWLNHAQGAGE